MYIDGFKGKKIQDDLIIRDLKNLKDAMAFAEKIQKGFSEYEDENLMRSSNTSSSSKNNHTNSHKNYKINYQNSKKLTFNNNFNNFNKSNSKSSYNNQSMYSKMTMI